MIEEASDSCAMGSGVAARWDWKPHHRVVGRPTADIWDCHFRLFRTADMSIFESSLARCPHSPESSPELFQIFVSSRISLEPSTVIIPIHQLLLPLYPTRTTFNEDDGFTSHIRYASEASFLRLCSTSIQSCRAWWCRWNWTATITADETKSPSLGASRL